MSSTRWKKPPPKPWPHPLSPPLSPPTAPCCRGHSQVPFPNSRNGLDKEGARRASGGGTATYNRRERCARNRRGSDGRPRHTRQEVAMKLVPVKQAQAKLFNAPADQGTEVAHSGDVQEGPLPHPRARRRGLAPRRGRLREEPLSPPPGAPAKRMLKEASSASSPQRQRLFGRGSLTRAPRSVAEAPRKCTKSRVISVRSRR